MKNQSNYFSDEVVENLNNMDELINLTTNIIDKDPDEKRFYSKYISRSLSFSPSLYEKVLKELNLEELSDETINDKDKDFLDKALSIMEKYLKQSYYNSHSLPFHIMNKKQEKLIFDTLNESDPSDIIELDKESVENLLNIWRGNKSWEKYRIIDPHDIPGDKNSTDKDINFYVPDDIIKTKSVPLEDFSIVLSYTSIKARIKIFENYYKYLDTLSEKNPFTTVGIVLMDYLPKNTISKPVKIVSVIMVYYDDKRVGCNGIGFSPNLTPQIKEKISSSEFDIIKEKMYIMQIWYSIQVALLHPVIKDVFLSSENRKRRSFDNSLENIINVKNYKVKYIKYNRIENEKFDTSFTESVSEGGKKFTRKTMAWYVIGHERIKNGKKEKVKPYWKGPMRELKKIDSPRKREIII